MNKREITVNIAEKFGVTQKQAAELVDYTLDLMYNAAMSDGEARWGTHVFKQKTRPARKGHNPRTGEEIQVPEKTVVVYNRTASFLSQQD